MQIAMLGDSITAGYGIEDPDRILSVRLEDALKADGRRVKIVNAGVSGDTTSDGLDRLDWSIPKGIDVVLVGLGGNDMLRLLPPGLIEKNLNEILNHLAGRKMKVILLGMKALPNYGPDYTKAFDAIYPRLAARHKIPLYPFLLDGAYLDPGLMQDDGIHPNEKGVDAIVSRLAPFLESRLPPVPACPPAGAP